MYIIKRVVAYLIDCLLCYGVLMLVVQGVILANLRESIGISDEWMRNSWHLELYILVTISLPVWVYFIFLDSRQSNGTIGKRIFNLQVVKSNGKKLILKQSLLRTFFKLLPWELAHIGMVFPTPLYFDPNAAELRSLQIVSIVLLGFYLISFFLNKKHQTLYDIFIGTQVVSSKTANY